MAYSDLDSMELWLKNQETDGVFNRFASFLTGVGTAGDITSGYIQIGRSAETMTVPSVSGSYNGWVMNADIYSEDNATALVMGLEYDLRSLAVSTNVFSNGSDASMPTKTTRINGITYSGDSNFINAYNGSCNYCGNCNNSYINYNLCKSKMELEVKAVQCTLPTNPVLGKSAFDMTPHLATKWYWSSRCY